MPPIMIMVSLMGGLLLLTVLRKVSCEPAGVKLQLSQRGLNYAANVAVDVLDKNILNQKIPDLTGKATVLVIGEATYSIKNAIVTGTTKPTATVAIIPGIGMTWSIANAGYTATGDWAYSYTPFIWGTISHSGTFNLVISGASVSLTVNMGRDSAGRPTIAVQDCACSIDKLDVTFYGGILTFIYNMFSGTISLPVKMAVQTHICGHAIKTFNINGAKQLSTLQTSVSIGDKYVTDYKLVDNILFATDYIQSSHKGEVFFKNDPTEAPFFPTDIKTDTPNRMFSIYMTAYPFNTAAHVAQVQGILSYHLTTENAPLSLKKVLAVDCDSGICAGTILPDLKTDYSGCFLEVLLQTSVRPILTISAGEAKLAFAGQIDVGVRKENDLKMLVSLDVTASCSLSVGVRGNNITAQIVKFTHKINIFGNSGLINIDENDLNEIMDSLVKLFVISHLNDIGELGFEIPSLYHVELTEPNIQFIEGALVISGDVKYKP